MADDPTLVQVSRVLAAIADPPLTAPEATRAVALLARAAKNLLPGTAGTGASLLDGADRRISAASTDDMVRAADARQYDLGEGPCLEAWATGRTVVSNDVPGDPRWPRGRDAVSDLPITAVLSTPLATRGRRLGALKAYASGPADYTPEAARDLELLAGVAAILLGTAHTDTTRREAERALKAALASRDTIGRACGVLMERHDLAEDAAMRRLMDGARGGTTLLQAARRVLEPPRGAPE
jgi:GAF domain-containing protein